MKKKACHLCGGSGKVMGMGMMSQDCDNCDGSGKVFEHDDEIGYLTDTMKKTEGYQNAKERLMAKDENLSDEDAEKLLDEAFEKEKPKRGRPARNT